MDGVVDMKEKDKYTWDGMPIHGAFDSEEEYQKALEEYKQGILALWEDMNRFDELCRTNPEAARATAEASHARSEAAARAAAEASRAESEAAARATAEAEVAESEVAPEEAPEPYSS